MGVYIDNEKVLNMSEGQAVCGAAIAVGLDDSFIGNIVLGKDDWDSDEVIQDCVEIIDGHRLGTNPLDWWVYVAVRRLQLFLEGNDWDTIEAMIDEEHDLEVGAEGFVSAKALEAQTEQGEPEPFEQKWTVPEITRDDPRHPFHESKMYTGSDSEPPDDWRRWRERPDADADADVDVDVVEDEDEDPFDDPATALERPWYSPGDVEEKRSVLRTVAADRLVRWETQVEDVLVRLWERQEKQVLARLNGKQAKKGTRHWNPPGPDPIDVSKVVEVEPWANEAFDELVPVFDRLYADTHHDVNRSLARFQEKAATPGPIPANMRNLYAKEARKRMERVAEVIEEKADVIRDVIQQFDLAGADLRSISDAVREEYQGARGWAQNVSQWQVNGAINQASMLAVQDMGDTGLRKEWLSSHDTKVRLSHKTADGQSVSVDKPFKVGFSLLQYPHDMNGPIEETINCRCTMLFFRENKSLSGVKHNPGGRSHNQMSHGRGKRGASYSVATSIEDGDALDLASKKALSEEMGVLDGYPTRNNPEGYVLRGDDDGFPVMAEAKRNKFNNVEETGDVQDAPYTFRAVSEADWTRMQEDGFLNSDGRMNLVESEGMVTVPSRLPVSYLPKSEDGRILRIDLRREDGWRVDPVDDYVKTNISVPIDRVSMVTPRISPSSAT